MSCYGRIFFFVMVLFVLILYSLLYYWVTRNSLSSKSTGLIDLCQGEIARDTITALKYNKTFIIAPYFDKRQINLTRVIGIVHHNEVRDLYCWFCCQSDGKVSVERAAIDVHSDLFGFPYGTADLLCVEPQNCDPNYVSIHWSPKGNIVQLPRFEIKNRDDKTLSVEFTVCISTMFGNYNNVLQFIQSIEMYKILGAQKVVIYKNSCSQLMEKALEFYVAEGTVEIIPWPITSYFNVSSYWHFSMDTKDIGYYGQITALNDCVYRNMYRSKFVLLNDIDEIILPIKHLNWKTMMSSLQEQNPGTGIFLFENHIFPKTVYSSNEAFNISSWSAVPGVNILQHIYKEPDRPWAFSPRKMIVDPKKVIQTSVHSVLKAYGSSLEVSRDIAITYHCRDPLQGNIPKKFLTKDPTLWRYNLSLIKNVNKVLKKQYFKWTMKKILQIFSEAIGNTFKGTVIDISTL
ncbi:beta-1,4-galactosyltransferase galt-1-like [Gopherus evgoodei]|uniref:beta-1,4-galactosyltransferase galt-1-like n=1 Tax=Gopherus evgoodei TaxID=1825980 RepID=UPI0011CF3014|nr:beta-1,4-galactosyltransferase galt-1-like [Gopherus evgoodei]XP_030391514.1 beta-1,4-galactosyltransferase galt-1-like [Gopherus evgoodei]XP_030391515.1 beta-1,4-galactosyltransferase galt-1-like [Gopherus evgoodei]